MRHLIISLLSLLAIIFITGCATLNDVLKDKDNGTYEVYPVNFDQAWEIAMTVLRWEDCETIEQHKEAGYMLTTVGQNFVSAGSVVGVWVEEAGKESSKVTVVTKRKVQTNLATGLTETTFHNSFKKAVKIIKAGNKLPFEEPSSSENIN